MAVRWRDLLDHLQISWTDSSRYAGHGWIGIACRWCGDDPGFHLGIHETEGHYRCLRNPDHRGRSSYYLLQRLGVAGRDVEGLLRDYGDGSAHPAAPPPPPRDVAPLARRWGFFASAAESPAACSYLQQRGFPDPERTIRGYDLRVGSGRWAGRLWCALRELDRSVAGFTGRALDDWREPRYYTECAAPMLYMPRPPSSADRLGIIVEGPFDALKVIDATSPRRPVFVAALCGLSVSGVKRLQLAEIVKTIPHLAVALDSSVWAVEAERLIDEIRVLPALGSVVRLALPPGVGDPAEMTHREVEQWLSTM